MTQLFGGVYKNKTVLVIGDTGFKGSWLVHWLLRMQAKVVGFSLGPTTRLNHYGLLKEDYTSVNGDINNIDDLKAVFQSHKPDIVFHMAAQSLVRFSYSNPIDTLNTNIMGTANVLEAGRQTDSVKAIVNVTSDKCYENKEWIWGYRENDAMGGHDPYSASKGCAELITASYQKSFFQQEKLLASVRAGNVIGGGDWSQDRLIPDMVKAASSGEPVSIRNPLATRPWQHVLDPLSGYLTLGQRLLSGERQFAEGWNFGPDHHSNVTVKTLVDNAKKYWETIDYRLEESKDYHEAHLLMLDCSKSSKLLKWAPVWDFQDTLKYTLNWYKTYYELNKLTTTSDLEQYVMDAKSKKVVWTL
ncbi:MAG: CDP-glucose 4,6-dehydratase [Bacteroidota bacterium]